MVESLCLHLYICPFTSYRLSQNKIRMEFNYSSNIEEKNSSVDEELLKIYESLGVAHLIIVVIPTLVLAPVVIYCLCTLMKASGVKPVSLLFLFLAILCMLGPLSYGILLDITLITAIPVFGNCTTQHPVAAIQLMVIVGLAMAISVTIAMIAVLQFMVLHCRRVVVLKYVIVVYAFLLLTTFGVSGIFFNGGYTEIRGSYCKGLSGPVNIYVCSTVGYIVPALLSVVLTVLTCRKLKRDVSSQMNSIARYVIATNVFNIFSYLVLRLGALLVYSTAVTINPTENTLYLWVVLSRNIQDLNYPLTLLSVLIVHSGVRRKIFMGIKPSSEGVVVSMETSSVVK